MLNKSFWKGKKVLITGHTGFKGSWLCLWLIHLDANISGLSLPEPVSTPNLYDILGLQKEVDDHRGNIINLDICHQIIAKVKPEIIIHMAAQPLVRESYTDPLTTYNTNVIGTANILEAARSCEFVKTIVVVTTDKCYENVEKNYAYVETNPLGGYDPYSSSKACVEHVASAYYRSFFSKKGVGLATARAGNVIGGGDWSADRLISDAVRAWSQNQKMVIRYPESTRPWQHVLEPLSGYLTLAETLWSIPEEFSCAWNFGPDINSIRTVQETVELSVKVWGTSTGWERSNIQNPHEATLLQLNSEKARKMLGWVPKWEWSRAVEETIAWYKIFYERSSSAKIKAVNQMKNYIKS